MSSTTSQMHGGQPNLANQYLLSNVDSASSSFNSATSTLISNEMINQASANSCSYSSSYSVNEKMFNSATAATMMPHTIDLVQHTDAGGGYKKKRKKHHKSERSKGHSGEVSLPVSSAPAVYKSGPNALAHQYPVHHYVQQTESFIISTRKLRVVESVACPLPPSSQFHPNMAAQSNRNTNYHHPGASFAGGKPQTSQALSDSYTMSQSAALSTLLNRQASSSAASLNLHCQNEMATLTHQNNLVLTSGTQPKKKHKKKSRRHRREEKAASTSNSSSQQFSNDNLYIAGADTFNNERLRKAAHCDSHNRVSSRSHSSSSSSSSSSDSEQEEPRRATPNMAYRRKEKQKKKRPNSSFSSSTSNSSSSDSSSSSSSSSSSFSSSDDENKSARSSRSSSSSSSSSSGSSSSSNSSDSCDEANGDVLNKISVKQTGEEQTECRNYYSKNEDIAANVDKYAQTSEVGASSATDQIKVDINQMTSFQSSAFSMDTLLHQQQTSQTNESTVVEKSIKETQQMATLATGPQCNAAATLSFSKQNTPLSSTILSDDCNSIESPLSVESSGRDSGKDELLRPNVKRRDPAEERQRLRSYRIPHHLTSNRATLAKSTEPATITPCVTSTTLTTTAPLVSSSISTTVLTTKVGSVSLNATNENISVGSTHSSTVVTSSNSSQLKKERTPSKVTLAEANKSGTNNNSQAKKPVAIISSNATKVTNSVLAPSHQSGPFLNSSFFVPGSTPTFPYSQHYPFSPAFMPALFQNQFLNNVTVSKASGAGSSPQTRFLHPSQSQSQLTIFTSPNALGSNAAPHALSPFSFSSLGTLGTHSALLSPTFSSSALSNSGTSTPLLVPKSLNFSPNFSFASGSMDPASLMMLGIANSSKASSSSSTATTSSSTHHTPPFILPRIVTTSTAVSITPTTVSRSNQHLLTKPERATSQSKPIPIKSSLIISTSTASGTNAQHSPMSTILPQQTLFLLQPPIVSSFAGKSVITNSPLTTSKNSTSSSKESIGPAPITTSTAAALNSGRSTVKSGVTSTLSPSVRPTLPGSFIFSPNSSSSPLPYALFSPPHHQALMQPISIQAPPPPAPSSLLGTQLLLSVISPTHRNQLTATSLATQLKLPLPSNTSQSDNSNNLIKQTQPATKSASVGTESAKLATSTSSESKTVTTLNKIAPTPLVTISSNNVTIKSKSTSTITVHAPRQAALSSASGKANPSKSSTTKDLFPTLNENFYKDTLSSKHLSKPPSTGVVSSSLKLNKSPDANIIASPNNDEFESLVQSVNDQIQSFQSGSEFDDDDMSPVKSGRRDAAQDSFNSKKMLSLMIKADEGRKAEIGDRSRAKLKDKTKCSTESLHESTKKSSTIDIMTPRTAGASLIDSKAVVRETREKTARPTSSSTVDTRKHCDQKAVSKEVSDLVKKSSSSSKSSGKRKHKEKRKAKGKDGKSSLHRLDNKSTSRHKSRSKKSRSHVKSLHKDPALMAQIENVITKLEALHLSTTKVTLWSSGPLLPPMFRVISPKIITTKATSSKAARFPGQRNSSSSKQSESQATQCLLPLKKRHPRNPDDSSATNSSTSSTHSLSRKSDHPTIRVNRNQENVQSPASVRQSEACQTKLSAVKVKPVVRKRSSSRTSQSEVPAKGTQTEDQIRQRNGAAPGQSLNVSPVAPPGDRSLCQKTSAGSVSAVAAARRQQQKQQSSSHGVAATVVAEQDRGSHAPSSQSRQQRGSTTVPSETILATPRTPQLPLPSTTSAPSTSSAETRQSTLPHRGPDADRDAHKVKPTKGRKKKSIRPTNSTGGKVPLEALDRVSSPQLRSSSSHHTHAASSPTSSLTSDLRPKSAKPATNATTTTTNNNNYSSLDEPSDADDEFDSDDEKSSTKQQLVSSNSTRKSAVHSSTGPTSSNQLRETESRKMAKAPKSVVRVNGLPKSVNGKSPSAVTQQQVPKQDNLSIDAKKRTAKAHSSNLNHVNGNLSTNSIAKTVPIKDGKVKKKRRRAVNKTGFDKPRKRNKTVNSATGKSAALAIQITAATKSTASKSHSKTLPQSNHVNGHSSQSEDDVSKRKKLVPNRRIKTKTNGDSEASSSTEIDEHETTRKSKTKSHKTIAIKMKTNLKRKKLLVKSDSSDSDKARALLASSSASSQDEDDNEKIPLSATDYPIFMVTKPSRKTTKNAQKKKVHPIKSNPFIRSIPSKKYFKVGLYSNEFAELYPEESKTANPLVKVDTVESQTDDLPVLPFPPFFSSHELVSTSSSSCSSSLEDEESLEAKNSRKKFSKRQKLLRLKELTQLAPKPVLDESGFTLSFDIWYQYKFNPLPTAMSSANYRRVRQNVFVDMKPVAKHSHQSCNCTVPKHGTACGSDCINRLMYQECWPQTCPAKKACRNQRIQRYEWSPGLERFMTEKRGWGIRTTECIKAGEFILEYIGEIVSDQLFKKRMTERYGNDQHHYSLKIDAGMVIDGYRVANEGRFVNHSCEPNCEMQKWAVNGYYRMCIFALRDIKPNEELFYDYNFHNFNLDSQQTCYCGSSLCRGFIGGKRANLKSSTSMDVASSNSPDVNNSNENSKDTPTQPNIIRFCKALSLCTGEETWNDSQVTISKNSQKRVRKDNFCFVNCKTKKVNVGAANSIDNLPTKSNSKKLLSKTDSSIEISYDPNLLCILKVKPQSQSAQTNIRKMGVFLLRNYRNTRKRLSLISSAVNGKPEPNPYVKQKTNYRNSPVHLNGHSSESESNSDSNSKSLLSCKSIGKSLLAAIESDKLTVHSMIKHTQIFNDICAKIRSFVRQKLILMLQAEDNLIKPTNGDRSIQNGTLKRPYNHDSFETAFADGFCSFKPIYELIKTTPFLRAQFFESEMIKYIQKQLQMLIEFPGDKVLFKRMKLNSTNVLENDMKNLMYGETAIFSQRQIKSLEKNILTSLDCALKERKCDIDEIIKKISNNDFDNSCLSLSVIIKHLNKFENNNLSELSKRKLILFSKTLAKVHISDIFNSNNPTMFDLTTTIDCEICKSTVAFTSSPLHELSLKSSPAPSKQIETEEVIRCICGSMREEGQMIQCDRCQVWQHYECVQQFSHISDLEDSEYHCEKCQSKSVPLDIPYPNHIPNFIEAAKDLLPSMKYFRSLESPVMKGLQIKLGDCVYIYRKSDSKINLIQQGQTNKRTQNRAKLSQNTEPLSTEGTDIAKRNFIDSLKDAAATAVKNLEHTFDPRECIIIRVEHLAMIESTNQRILYGYHYLWPEETYHEPSRKFYMNEVLQSPNQEWAALDEVRGLCCVLDPATYCKGRPKAFQPNDIFICEYRVDRFAKSFAKRKKFNYPICTKSYAFDLYESKLKPKRTYSPHLIPESDKPLKGKNDQTNSKQAAKNFCDKDDPAYNEKVKNAKMTNLQTIANKLNESAYFWYLLLEQEQDKKSDHEE